MRHSHPIARTAPLLLVALCLIACDKVKAPGAGRPEPLPLAAYPQIVALEGLDKYMGFDRPVIAGGADKPLSIQVPVRLISDEEVNIQYKFEFFDANKRQVGDTGWRNVRLPARAQRFIEGAALDTNAVDWRLLIRPARG